MRTFIVSLIIIALIAGSVIALMSVLYVGDIGDAPVRLKSEVLLMVALSVVYCIDPRSRTVDLEWHNGDLQQFWKLHHLPCTSQVVPGDDHRYRVVLEDLLHVNAISEV